MSSPSNIPPDDELREQLRRLLDEDEAREREQKRNADWSDTRLFGTRLALVFVFLVPLLGLCFEFAGRMILRSNDRIIAGLDYLLWICAGGMVTLIAYNLAGGYKNGKNGNGSGITINLPFGANSKGGGDPEREKDS